MRRRRSHRRRKNHTVRNIVVGCFVMTLLFATGYSAFQTVININVKGNVKTMYASDTIKKLLKNNGLTMFTDPFGNIRYTGPNDDVHNYVCLVDESPCQDKHLFRIIGSFINIDDGNGKLETRVKVIKATEYSEDYWNTSESNNWARPATLNTTLNTIYYDSFDNVIKNVIGNVLWRLGGFSSSSISSYESYNSERGIIDGEMSLSTQVYTGKIALMYPSDYAYASSNCRDVLLSSYSNCINRNWLFGNRNDGKQSTEWTLTRLTGHSNNVICIYSNGNVTSIGYSGSSFRNTYVVRPVFFFKSNTLLVTENHDGTFNNPYIVKINT